VRRHLASLLFLAATTGCDVALPVDLTASFAFQTGPEAVVDAAVPVLTDEGYTVLSADRRTGFVTTDWREESSFASQALLGLSKRTRLSVVFDPVTVSVMVQMTSQKKDGDAPWRTDDLSSGDRAVQARVLRRIQDRVSLLGAGTVTFEGTGL
jgi:hypothetical protein